MNKVFIYMYPIEEFINILTFDDGYYQKWNREDPLKVLNETIDLRYRKKGYKVVYVLYKDKDLYGLDLKENDEIVRTNTNFEDALLYNDDGTRKDYNDIKMPSEQAIFNKLKDVDKLVVGGFHFSEAVKRVAEIGLKNNIDSLVDLELTDLFFSLYYEDGFEKDNYDLDRYKKQKMKRSFINFKNLKEDEKLKLEDVFEEQFSQVYESPAYGFYRDDIKIKQQ